MSVFTFSDPQLRTDPAIVFEWLVEAMGLGPGENWAGQRGYLRFLWNVPLDIHVPGPGRRSRVLLGQSQDVSASGLRFLCRQPLPPFSRVIIARAGERIGAAAKVVNRIQTVGGFLVGVQFDVPADSREAGCRTA